MNKEESTPAPRRRHTILVTNHWKQLEPKVSQGSCRALCLYRCISTTVNQMEEKNALFHREFDGCAYTQVLENLPPSCGGIKRPYPPAGLEKLAGSEPPRRRQRSPVYKRDAPTLKRAFSYPTSSIKNAPLLLAWFPSCPRDRFGRGHTAA